MWDIQGTTITLTRGDSFNARFKRFIKAENEGEEDTLYELQPGDIVRFAVKKEPTDDEPLLVKILDGYDLHLNPQDTIGLDFINYYYDVYITFADYNRDTYITEGKFRIAKEQHRKWRL